MFENVFIPAELIRGNNASVIKNKIMCAFKSGLRHEP